MVFLKEKSIWQLLRLVMSFMLLWAFFDKVFGLGFATLPNKSWLSGVSPTTGFLKFAPDGPFAPLFHSFAGSSIVDVLFMGGLLLIGLSLLLGIGVRIAGYCGALLMLLMYLALFPPENNPLIDEHIIYIAVFLGLAIRSKTQKFGFGEKWARSNFVKKYPILE